jgi:hypothetical protein
MKRSGIVILSLFSFFLACSQSANLPPLDKSPMDMSYFPNNYPVLKIQNKTTELPMARVIYSRPQKNGRTIFGDLVEYGKVWRLGANEATEIEFFKAVKIGGKKIPKGKYTLYALVNQDNWVMILNRELDTWGSFAYDAQKDIVRVSVPVTRLTEPVEPLSMFFDKSNAGADLVIEWDVLKVVLPISIK